MSLIDQIITAITETDEKTSAILRRCLVLAYQLRNDDLKAWVSKELNGYDMNDPDLPEYRKVRAPAKGLFIGPLGSQINDQPLPSAVLEPDHRRFAETADLVQPIAAYEEISSDSNLQIAWSANLTLKYQSVFFGGNYALNRAWQEIPGSCFVAIVDTVRTRLLTLVLELKNQT
uniref:AbiTii domain-containing protein n=1 Tax=Albidovulum sp. TaxID=1872424 RepID=UPI0039B8CC54